MLPLYEAKLIHLFDHRLACYSKRQEANLDTELPRLDLEATDDPSRFVMPRYWVQDFDTLDKQKTKPEIRPRSWRLITPSRQGVAS